MSLHFLGIRDFPILHRQLSSPPSQFLETSSLNQNADHDLARDSKDVLIQRLSDLSHHLMNEENLEDEIVTSLHVEVDRMERTIRRSTRITPERSFEESRNATTPPAHDDDTFWGPFSLSRKINMRLLDSLTQTSRLRPRSRVQRVPYMTPDIAASITQQAEDLLQALGRTMGELQARREETAHIHDLLIARSESAVQRVIELEDRVKELDVDFEENQSELSFLRLQMRALEVQGMAYIPFNADEDLSQSITNWKLDWADVNQRTRARRRNCREILGDGKSDDSQTVVVEH